MAAATDERNAAHPADPAKQNPAAATESPAVPAVKPDVPEQSDVPEEQPTIAARFAPPFEETPTNREPLFVPDAAPHPTTRLFDDLGEQRTEIVGGMRLPESIEAELGPKERPSWRPPLLVWVLTGLLVSLAAMCTFLYPTYSGYDEPFHVDMTYSYYNGNGFYAPTDRLLSIGVQNSDKAGALPPKIPFSQQSVLPRGQRQSLDANGGDRAGTYPIPNQMVQHPPLYYAIGAGLLHLVPGSHNLPYDRWVAILRYMSILMIAPLPILAWASAKALVGDGPAAVTAAVLPLTLPNLARIGGNVNNDNLLTLLTAGLILVLCKVLAGDLRKRTGLLVGVIIGLACLTKGYGLVLPLVAMLAYGLAWLRHRRRPWAPVGMAALFTAAIGGWWWVRNLVLYGAVQPNGLGKKGDFGYDSFFQISRHPPAGTYTIREFIPAFLVRVLWRTWGGIGLAEGPMFARTVDWVWFGIVAAGAIFAIAFGIRGRYGRLSAALFVVPTIVILALPMAAAVSRYTYNGILPGSQGRYLYPTVTAVGLLLGVGYTRFVGRKLAGWLPLVVVIGALGTQVLAWRQLIHVWWVPANVHDKSEEFKQAFRGILRWSPWSHAVTTGPFIAVLAFGLLLLVSAVWYGVAHRAGDDEPVVTDGGSVRDQLPESSIPA